MAVVAEHGTRFRVTVAAAGHTEILVEQGTVTARLWKGASPLSPAHSLVLRGGSGPGDAVYGSLVSGNLFDVVGVRPLLGRFFLPEEDRTELTHPVLLVFPGELAVALGAVAILHRPAGDRTGRPFALLSVGTLAAMVADLIYEYDYLIWSAWSGPTGDLLLAFGATLVVSAAWRARTAADGRPLPAYAVGPAIVPHLAIGVVGALALIQWSRPDLEHPALQGLVLGLVLGEGMRLTAVGLLVGLPLAAAAAPLVRSLLFGMPAHDAVTFVAMPLLLAAVALLASYLPARRAAAMEPWKVLREE